MNPSPPTRWTDERLDDLANQVASMRDMPSRVAVMENRLLELAADMHDCKTGIDGLHAVRSEERRERKRDLQWMIGAIFVAATIVIGALGLFLG